MLKLSSAIASAMLLFSFTIPGAQASLEFAQPSHATQLPTQLKSHPKELSEPKAKAVRAEAQTETQTEVRVKAPRPARVKSAARAQTEISAQARLEKRIEALEQEVKAYRGAQRATEAPAEGQAAGQVEDAAAVQTQAQVPAKRIGARSAGGNSYEAVPANQIEPVARRLKLVEQLIRKYGRAYDYRAHTNRELEQMLARLKASAPGAARVTAPIPAPGPGSASVEAEESAAAQLAPPAAEGEGGVVSEQAAGQVAAPAAEEPATPEPPQAPSYAPSGPSEGSAAPTE